MFGILKDERLRAALARDGFVVLPWLDTAGVEVLRNIWAGTQARVAMQGFATTTTSADIALKEEIFGQIRALYGPLVERHFQDYKLLGAGFLQKDPGPAGFLPIHQDWTVTAEDRYRTFTIWVPLEDCGDAEGALQMLPGGHMLSNVLRGPNLRVALDSVSEELRPKLRTLHLRAGEAVLFDHSVVHGSLPVVGDKPRIAATFGLTAKDAPLRFWYHHAGDAADRVEQLSVPDDFFLRYHAIGTRPECGQSLGYYRQSLEGYGAAEKQDILAGGQVHRPIFRDLQDKACLQRGRVANIVREQEWNVQLAQRGYVTFPLLDENEVAGLVTFFERNQSGAVDRFYASVHNDDIDFRLRMDAELQRVVGGKMAGLLQEGELLGGSFIAKPPGSGGILPPHADWNIVDERMYRSYNLWIPLVDTVVSNGAIHVIPGSHDWLDTYRGPGISNPFAAHDATIWSAMEPLELKAGTALLYDHRLLHASPLNKSQVLRLACVLGVKPKDAALRYYHGQNGIVRAYGATSAFFLTQNPEEGPGALPLLGVVTDHVPVILPSDLDQWLGRTAVDGEGETPQEVPARGFWQTYSPGNILREILWRLKGRPS